MASKFNDKIAVQMFEDALAAYELALKEHKEIFKSRAALQTELLSIENSLEINEKPLVNLMAMSEIDAAVDGQEARRAELEHAHNLATRKLRLTADVRDRISVSLIGLKAAVAQARAALAASYERWTLEQPAIKKTIEAFCECRAMWNSALYGRFDSELWCIELLHGFEPTDGQHEAADKLMRVPADE